VIKRRDKGQRRRERVRKEEKEREKKYVLGSERIKTRNVDLFSTLAQLYRVKDVIIIMIKWVVNNAPLTLKRLFEMFNKIILKKSGIMFFTFVFSLFLRESKTYCLTYMK
jgi:hypothetical protein